MELELGEGTMITRASPTVISFDTARDLIDHLSPLNPIWHRTHYIFRGQPDDDYKLTPSVCRTGRGSFAYGSPRRVFDETTSGQVEFEFEVIKRFLGGCDRAGLTVPGYSEQVKREIEKQTHLLPDSYIPWPPERFYEIMAVAQHYDVPTRLLDWTERSFVACYFAASSAKFELDTTTMPRIAIWALDTTFADEWTRVKIIRTPGGTSKNQAAQSGLFTTHNITTYGVSDKYQSEALEDIPEIYHATSSAESLIKMTLPVSEAPELLQLCSKLGVDGSTLFPGYNGVAKMVRDWANVEVGITLSQDALDQERADYYD